MLRKVQEEVPKEDLHTGLQQYPCHHEVDKFILPLLPCNAGHIPVRDLAKVEILKMHLSPIKTPLYKSCDKSMLVSCTLEDQADFPSFTKACF